jgi:membrane fusion protein, macrolide-specific efflux system
MKPVKKGRRLFCKRHFLIAIAVLLCGILLSRCYFAAHKKPAYLTAPVVRLSLEEVVLATGVLEASKQVDVGARVTGQLKSLKVKLGDQVKNGQLLAEIDPLLQTNTLRHEQANLALLLAKKQVQKARLQDAERIVQREQQLLAQDAISQQVFEAARLQRDIYRAELAASTAQVKQARIQVAAAQAKLDYTRIHAPVDGEVVSIVTKEGQTISAQQQTPIILILADLGKMTIKAQVSEADVIRLQPGQAVYFTMLGALDTRYEGKLSAIESTPAQGSQTQAIFYNALFEVPNPDRQLRIGMTTQVSIILNHADDVLTIPVSALGEQDQDKRYAVRVLGKDGTVQDRKVQTGINNRVNVQVLDGVQADEQVIIGEAPIKSRASDNGE